MEISDPRTIRALAHPLRLDLLQVLGASGPATAAQCGRLLGVSQASCSFHLRQLAKYGFVEDAMPSGHDRRERRWQVAHQRMSVRFSPDDDAIVRQQIEKLVVEREMQAILDYSRRPGGADAEWERKAGIVTAMAVMSPDEAAAIKEKWIELLAPYIARASADSPRILTGQRHVRYFMAATPLAQPGPDDSKDGRDD